MIAMDRSVQMELSAYGTCWFVQRFHAANDDKSIPLILHISASSAHMAPRRHLLPSLHQLHTSVSSGQSDGSPGFSTATIDAMFDSLSMSPDTLWAIISQLTDPYTAWATARNVPQVNFTMYMTTITDAMRREAMRARRSAERAEAAAVADETAKLERNETTLEEVNSARKNRLLFRRVEEGAANASHLKERSDVLKSQTLFWNRLWLHFGFRFRLYRRIDGECGYRVGQIDSPDAFLRAYRDAVDTFRQAVLSPERLDLCVHSRSEAWPSGLVWTRPASLESLSYNDGACAEIVLRTRSYEDVETFDLSGQTFDAAPEGAAYRVPLPDTSGAYPRETIVDALQRIYTSTEQCGKYGLQRCNIAQFFRPIADGVTLTRLQKLTLQHCKLTNEHIRFLDEEEERSGSKPTAFASLQLIDLSYNDAIAFYSQDDETSALQAWISRPGALPSLKVVSKAPSPHSDTEEFQVRRALEKQLSGTRQVRLVIRDWTVPEVAPDGEEDETDGEEDETDEDEI